MDSFGRLPDDVINVIQTMYFMPIIDIINKNGKNYIRLKYPHFTSKFELPVGKYTLNDKKVIDLLKMICYKRGNFLFYYTSIKIDKNIVLKNKESKITLSLNNLDTFITALTTYYKLITTNDGIEIDSMNNNLYSITNTNIRVQFNVDTTGNKIETPASGIILNGDYTEDDIKLFQLLILLSSS